MTNGQEKKTRKLAGQVVSDKMDKTVVVKVDRFEKNEKYQKYFRISNKFKAHDENNEFKVGDSVIISETRPLSKDKRHVVVGKVEK